MQCHALIVAAGRGSRFGAALPKQYAPLGGEVVLRRTLRVFFEHPAITTVRVAIHPDDRALYDASATGLPALSPVYGGNTRQASVAALLTATAAEPDDAVLIHDAARPFVSHDVIDRVIAALEESAGAIAALPVTDTLKRAAGGSHRHHC